MKRCPGLAFLPAVLLAIAPPSAAAAPGPIHLEDFRALVRISSPSFSPDGREIAFLTVRSDMVHDRYAATLWVLNITSGRSRVLLRKMRGLRMPRWSPDGRRLAFIPTAAAAGRRAIPCRLPTARRGSSAPPPTASSSSRGARTGGPSPS